MSQVLRPPRREAFEVELDGALSQARSEGRRYVDVNAGELHCAVGGYPAALGQHRMPQAVGAMRARVKRVRSVVLHSPPSGAGASLTVRFFLD